MLLSKEEVLSLRPKDREEYVANAILSILKSRPRGVTISEIGKDTGFSRETIAKHLERLVSIREAYKVVRSNLSIYHNNGKVVHESDANNALLPGSNRFYTFYRLENEEGNFIYVQEKEMDDYRGIKVNGGLMIDEKAFMTFMKELKEFALESRSK